MPGLDSCSTRTPPIIILGLLILIRNLLGSSLSGSQNGGDMQFEAISDIFPLQLAKTFGTFRDHFNTDAYGKKFPTIMHFVINSRFLEF
jgi:hypothetical protein